MSIALLLVVASREYKIIALPPATTQLVVANDRFRRSAFLSLVPCAPGTAVCELDDDNSSVVEM